MAIVSFGLDWLPVVSSSIITANNLANAAAKKETSFLLES